MNISKIYQHMGSALVVMAMSFSLHAKDSGFGTITGIEGSTFNLDAKVAQISTPDGDSFKIWGFADGADGVAQYPGPTLIVTEGDCITINLTNTDVPEAVSLDLPGQEDIGACDISGVSTPVTGAAESGDTVGAGGAALKYTFTARNPGTYMYYSGVSSQIQIDMGLVGALIVRPSTIVPAGAAGLAYDNEVAAYDREYLFFLSEMDPRLHYLADNDATGQWDNSTYKSVLWFINGRNAPDTLAFEGVSQLPHQPYSSLVFMHPGERVLLRVINAGRNQHPLHLHGNSFDQIARDGNLIETTGGSPGFRDYTLNSIQLSTADLIFEWTGKKMGWDIYDSNSDHGVCTDLVDNRTGVASIAPNPNPAGLPGGDGYKDVAVGASNASAWEWCADHGKPLPVVIPENQDLAFGGFYGGSPYLGSADSLPVGEGGLNPWGGMIFMWHSHTERELVNNNVFPGGMLTLLVVVNRN